MDINTDAYLVLGLVVVAVILCGYITSLVLRFRQTGKLVETLKSLKDEQ